MSMFDKKGRTEEEINASRGIFLTKRQLSALIAASFFLVILSFVIGYFWGQHYIIESVSARIEHDSFNDRLSSSMLNFYENSEADQNTLRESESPSNETERDLEQGEMKIQENVAGAIVEQPEPQIINKQYCALLSGGSERAMNQLRQRLQKQGISIEVKKRTSKTPKGKVKIWHQAVTKPFNDRDSLKNLVDSLKKREHLGEVKIVEIEKKG